MRVFPCEGQLAQDVCENFLTDTEFIVSRLKRCDKLDKGVNHEGSKLV
ncbi:hypothetical protein PNI0008_01455 [Streptococcus pneumoniae PNI0008]|nr:hypothetical protein PNI0008_01455 [Streptococcus pneumoniae PNI0008]